MKLKRVLPIELKIDVRPKLSETIAYSAASTVRSNFGSIYINDKKRFADGKVKPELYEKVRKEIMERLKHLKDPKTGEHIVKKVWRKEELYFGDKLDVAPDIIFMLSEEYQVRSGLGISQPFGNEIVRNSNGHALYGIFLAYSSDIKRGLKIENTKIYDLAPTLLYIMDVPIPKDLDGRVLKEIFREDSELSTRRIRYQNIEEREKTKIKLKIKGLRTLKKI
jgi:predicted AlkP superfamily phosphohydrolase/phosphomutase